MTFGPTGDEVARGINRVDSTTVASAPNCVGLCAERWGRHRGRPHRTLFRLRWWGPDRVHRSGGGLQAAHHAVHGLHECDGHEAHDETDEDDHQRLEHRRELLDPVLELAVEIQARHTQLLVERSGLFAELHADLPFATRALLFVATLFTTLWYIPFSAFLGFTSFMIWMFKSPTGRDFKDRLVLKLPVISGIMEYAILERFCRILGAMVKAGVPLPDAMRTTTEATNNSVFRNRLIEAQAEMMEGGGFAKPLARTDLFPGAARQMMTVGEETGTLDDQLASASEYFNRELEVKIRRFTSMFEPLTILMVGAAVGFVAIALVSAMYGVLDGFKGEEPK